MPPTFRLFNWRDEPDIKRYTELQEYFRGKFGEDPQIFFRCPGRVNLIGEHIDYSGYSVLPIAIEKYILVAAGQGMEGLKIVNLDSDKYESFESSATTIIIDKSSYHWYDYILCGFKGVMEEFSCKFNNLNIAIDGNIPPGAGLSSSSALVCAGASVVTYFNSLSLSRMQLAELCAKAEQYIGTQGGGMDQTIILTADEGYAKRIDFNPLQTKNVILPSDIQFIVAHSGVTVNKAASSKFNKRVAECILAAKVLSKKMDQDFWCVNKLSDVHGRGPGMGTLKRMILLTEKYLETKAYTRFDVCEVLEIEDAELSAILKSVEVPNSPDFETFELRKRALHVFSESTRVYQFIKNCRDKNYNEIGRILTNSHQSLKENYECSHDKLDAVVDVAMKAGALGARLTGAGWGGCIVCAVRTQNVEKVLEKVKDWAANEGLGSDAVFLTKPHKGIHMSN